MKKIIFILALIFAVNFAALDLFASVVRTTSNSSCFYEDGKFTPSDGGFEGVYIVDEPKGTISLDEVINNNREGRLEKGVAYDITNVVISMGPSSLNVSANKKGQRIITATRDDAGASETLIIGDNFYQFLRAADGRFYLEYGSVVKSPNVDEKIK